MGDLTALLPLRLQCASPAISMCVFSVKASNAAAPTCHSAFLNRMTSQAKSSWPDLGLDARIVGKSKQEKCYVTKNKMCKKEKLNLDKKLNK